MIAVPIAVIFFAAGFFLRAYIGDERPRSRFVWGKYKSLMGRGPQVILNRGSAKLAASAFRIAKTGDGEILLNVMKREFDCTQDPPEEPTQAYLEMGKRYVYKWLCGWIKLGAETSEGYHLIEEDSNVRVAVETIQ